MRYFIVIALLVFSSFAQAVRIDAGWTVYNGSPAGFHFTELLRSEQGQNSQAFLDADAYRDHPQCSNSSSGPLNHREAVVWIWYVCPGGNRGTSTHWAIVHNNPLNFGGKYISRVF